MTKPISIAQIVLICANYFDVLIEDINSNSREREIVQARHMAMYFSKLFTKHSLKKIGKDVAGRDHSSVLYALHVVQNSIDVKDDYLFPHIVPLEHQIRQAMTYGNSLPNVYCIAWAIQQRPLIQSFKARSYA